jgi:hypothetical protein
MREAQPDLHAAWVAQDDGHNGMAQGYHHTILPLASARDRRTEIRWGLRDFALRFGRPATGLWLAETAADHLTLQICAEEGVRWTILAPWQAATDVSVEHPRRIEVGSGHIGVVFYDAPLSGTLSFDANATSDADAFARHVLRPRLERAALHAFRQSRAHGMQEPGSGLDRRGAENRRVVDERSPAEERRTAEERRFADGATEHTHVDGDLVLIATDGELYGHHQKFRDLFLARLLSSQDGFTVTTAGAVMDGLDIRTLETVPLRDGTSWSCHHGVARWAGECPDVADGRWKRPLRQAFDRLAAAVDAVVEARLRGLGLDYWQLRDAYVDVASGFTKPEAWLSGRLAGGGGTEVAAAVSLDAEARRQVLALMRAVRSRLQMFASDGWFWGDPRRIETAQVLRSAAHAARIVDAELGTQLERALVDDLAAVRAPDVPDGAIPDLAHLTTGSQIYAAALSLIGQPAPRF